MRGGGDDIGCMVIIHAVHGGQEVGAQVGGGEGFCGGVGCLRRGNGRSGFVAVGRVISRILLLTKITVQV